LAKALVHLWNIPGKVFKDLISVFLLLGAFAVSDKKHKNTASELLLYVIFAIMHSREAKVLQF
jgi:hypothetical protein